MASSTALGFRYPTASDPVANGAQAVQNLAQDIDDTVGRIATGTATVTLSSSNTGVTAVIDFPAGRFTSAPKVTLGSNAQGFVWNKVSATATQLTLRVSTTNGGTSSTTVSCDWIAVQQ